MRPISLTPETCHLFPLTKETYFPWQKRPISPDKRDLFPLTKETYFPWQKRGSACVIRITECRQKRSVILTKGTCFHWQKRRISLTKETYFPWQKRPISLTKETHLPDKRDLSAWQKRLFFLTKESFGLCNKKYRMQTKETCHPDKRDLFSLTKEAYLLDKRDLSPWGKRPIVLIKKKFSLTTENIGMCNQKYTTQTKALVSILYFWLECTQKLLSAFCNSYYSVSLYFLVIPSKEM